MYGKRNMEPASGDQIQIIIGALFHRKYSSIILVRHLIITICEFLSKTVVINIVFR